MKDFRGLEFSKKLRKASKTRMKGYEDIEVSECYLVYYQHQDKKAWLGPAKMVASKGNDIFIFANGNIRKVPKCNIQICEKETRDEEESAEKIKGNVKFEEEGFGDNIVEKDVEIVDKRVTRSMAEVKRKEMRKYEISTFWMRVENTECFDEMAIYNVEMPLKEHRRPEVIEAI